MCSCLDECIYLAWKADTEGNMDECVGYVRCEVKIVRRVEAPLQTE